MLIVLIYKGNPVAPHRPPTRAGGPSARNVRARETVILHVLAWNATMADAILLERRHTTAILTLNRPQVHNAF
ncbi:MAG TPA: hypothetical protein VJQ42_07315, partial [Rhodanobacteraceae bacterium]|nr:hypothetical protein [Rhodanobacteraceae bacterium]